MRTPVVQTLEVRWIKQVIEYVPDELGKPTVPVCFHRFGYAFVEPSDQTRMAVAGFVRQLTQANAI